MRKQQFQISLEGMEKHGRVLSSRLKGYKRVNSDYTLLKTNGVIT